MSTTDIIGYTLLIPVIGIWIWIAHELRKAPIKQEAGYTPIHPITSDAPMGESPEAQISSTVFDMEFDPRNFPENGIIVRAIKEVPGNTLISEITIEKVKANAELYRIIVKGARAWEQ